MILEAFRVFILLTVVFSVGALFASFIVAPFSIAFLTSFSPGDVTIRLSDPDIADFRSGILLSVGLVFEIPLAIHLLARYRILRARTFRRLHRYAIVATVIIAAGITPTPDPFTQLTFAIPMYLLYELVILLARQVAPEIDDIVPPNPTPSP